MRVLVRLGDTLPALAETYLGSASQALFLAQFNSLEYPFIVNNSTFSTNVYATGSVVVTLLGTGPYTVALGQQFASVPGPANEVRLYATTASVVLNSTGQTATIGVQATIAGHWGNTLPNTITNAQTSDLSVTNPSPITGGTILRVLRPGDYINIPTSGTATAATGTRLSLKQYDAIGGVDLAYTATRGLQLTTDDLVASVNDQTIVQDIAATVATPLGSDPNNPTLGSYVPASLGSAGEHAMHRIAVLVQGVAQSDNRVQSVGGVRVAQQDTFVALQVPVTLSTGVSSVQVTVPAAGGA